MSALAKLSLFALFIIGGGTIHGLSIKAGYYDLVEQHKAKGVLHDGTLYDPKLTGVKGLDDFLGPGRPNVHGRATANPRGVCNATGEQALYERL